MSKKIKYYKNKADKLFQQYFIEKNKNCEMCGKLAVCGHHIITKGASSSTRYYEPNMVAVCTGCHLGFHSARSSMFIGRLIEKRGIDWFKDIEKESAKITKINISYYKKIIEKYVPSS